MGGGIGRDAVLGGATVCLTPQTSDPSVKPQTSDPSVNSLLRDVTLLWSPYRTTVSHWLLMRVEGDGSTELELDKFYNEVLVFMVRK